MKKQANELFFDTLNTVSIQVTDCKRDLVSVRTHGYLMKPNSFKDLKQKRIALSNSYQGKIYSKLLEGITRWLML